MDRTALDQVIEQWQSLNNSEERSQFYDNHVFPALKEYVIPREQQKHPQAYDCLILSVGLSPEPIILSVLTFRPTQVCLLYTAESKKLLDRIIDEANLKASQIEMAEISETRLQNIYQKIREVYEKWERPTRIAVDPTGGTKAMVAGCTLAGNLIGADLVYVSSDYNTILRKPNPGSESLILLDNPYDVFGDLEFTKAQALFRQLDYSSSKIILEDLEHKTSTPDRYKPLALLCSAYAHWDDLKIKDSVTDLRLSKDCLQRYLRLKTDSTILSSYPTILEQQIQTLENLDLSLNELGENKTVALSKPNLYLPLMGTLRACAIRQEKRGKRDVATLLWYRLLELLSQQRLSTYGLDTKCPDYNNSQLQNKISSDSLLEKYITCGLSTSKKGVKPENMTELPNIIDLINGYKLLKALDDPLAIDQDLNRITNQVNIRNNSIFAHGFKPLNDNSFMSFKTLVESLVDIFKTIQPENQAYWNDCIFVEEIV